MVDCDYSVTTAVERNVILSDRRPVLSNAEGERRIPLLRCTVLDGQYRVISSWKNEVLRRFAPQNDK